ncbi:MAG: hypothetical protein GX604_01570 [Actinobacteria bacterium]|nr:hypothetical protein [Actinomycetota bacterium]
MPGTAAARYYTNYEWRTHESAAARRSAARSAARAAAAGGYADAAMSRRRPVADAKKGSSTGLRTAQRSRVAHARVPQPVETVRSRPALRVVRISRKKRSVLMSVFGYLLAVLICCGAVPVLLNMAAFHYKAESAQMQKQADALVKEQTELEAQTVMLCAPSRLQAAAENLGLEHAGDVAYIEAPGVTCPQDSTTVLNDVAETGARKAVGALADRRP